MTTAYKRRVFNRVLPLIEGRHKNRVTKNVWAEFTYMGSWRLGQMDLPIKAKEQLSPYRDESYKYNPKLVQLSKSASFCTTPPSTYHEKSESTDASTLGYSCWVKGFQNPRYLLCNFQMKLEISMFIQKQRQSKSQQSVLQEEIGGVKGHFGPINALAFNPDGKSFSSGGEDGYVRLHHFDPDYFKILSI